MATKRVPLLAGPPRYPASFEAALDLVDDNGAMATLRPTPAHANQALALSDAFGEGFGCGAHRAIAFEVGFVFGAEALNDVVAGGGVGGIVENERIAEDAVSAVDVDGDFVGAGLAGAPARLLPRRMEPGAGAFMGSAPRIRLGGWPRLTACQAASWGVRGGQGSTGKYRLGRRAGGADFVEWT